MEFDPKVNESEGRRIGIGSVSKNEFKMQKHGSATAFPTVQLDLQVRGKDVSFPYHHALTVSSLGSDCQALPPC